MKIAIDIGHARGTGARGNGLEEHAACADIAAALAHILASRGHTCHIVDFPQLSNRDDLVSTVREINRLKPDVSLSLHCDASDNPAARGAHVCYISAKGETLARAIANELCAMLPGRAEQTVRRGDLYVLKNTVCPAVLVECGFITNPYDCQQTSKVKMENYGCKTQPRLCSTNWPARIFMKRNKNLT